MKRSSRVKRSKMKRSKMKRSSRVKRSKMKRSKMKRSKMKRSKMKRSKRMKRTNKKIKMKGGMQPPPVIRVGSGAAAIPMSATDTVVSGVSDVSEGEGSPPPMQRRLSRMLSLGDTTEFETEGLVSPAGRSPPTAGGASAPSPGDLTGLQVASAPPSGDLVDLPPEMQQSFEEVIVGAGAPPAEASWASAPSPEDVAIGLKQKLDGRVDAQEFGVGHHKDFKEPAPGELEGLCGAGLLKVWDENFNEWVFVDSITSHLPPIKPRCNGMHEQEGRPRVEDGLELKSFGAKPGGQKCSECEKSVEGGAPLKGCNIPQVDPSNPDLSVPCDYYVCLVCYEKLKENPKIWPPPTDWIVRAEYYNQEGKRMLIYVRVQSLVTAPELGFNGAEIRRDLAGRLERRSDALENLKARNDREFERGDAGVPAYEFDNAEREIRRIINSLKEIGPEKIYKISNFARGTNVEQNPHEKIDLNLVRDDKERIESLVGLKPLSSILIDKLRSPEITKKGEDRYTGNCQGRSSGCPRGPSLWNMPHLRPCTSCGAFYCKTGWGSGQIVGPTHLIDHTFDNGQTKSVCQVIDRGRRGAVCCKDRLDNITRIINTRSIEMSSGMEANLTVGIGDYDMHTTIGQGRNSLKAKWQDAHDTPTGSFNLINSDINGGKPLPDNTLLSFIIYETDKEINSFQVVLRGDVPSL